MEDNNQQQNNTSKEEIQDLLNQQTTVILNAVDEKITKLELSIISKIKEILREKLQVEI